ncbi:serine hydrolase [Ligilactobacillus sp. LYQ135]
MEFSKKIKKIMVASVTAITLFAGVSSSIISADNSSSASVSTSKLTQTKNQQLQLDIKGGIAVDEKTGQILFQQNANQPLPVASVTKLLTTYIILDAIKSGKLSWDQKITPTQNIVNVSQDTSLSNVPLSADKQYTVKSLYEAMLIYSANGATMALAQAVAGSQKVFVDLMKKQAEKFGIKDAQIYTTCGLTNSQVKNDAYPGAADNAENKFSAKDVALIASKLLQKYPEVLKTTSIKKLNFNNGNGETEMQNWNWMLPGGSSSYANLPVDGLKTGTSDAAQACFVGTTNKDGHRIITVVLGAQHKNDEDNSRFIQTQKMMSYVYDTYKYVTLDKGTNLAKVSVYQGKAEKVNVKSAKQIGLWIKKDQSQKEIKAKIALNKNATEKGALKAPVKKNKVIGKLTFEVNGQKVPTIFDDKGCQVIAQSAQNTEKANLFQLMWRKITGIFN